MSLQRLCPIGNVVVLHAGLDHTLSVSGASWWRPGGERILKPRDAEDHGGQRIRCVNNAVLIASVNVSTPGRCISEPDLSIDRSFACVPSVDAKIRMLKIRVVSGAARWLHAILGAECLCVTIVETRVWKCFAYTIERRKSWIRYASQECL